MVTQTAFLIIKKHIRHRSRYIPGSVGEGADSPSVAAVATVEGAIVVSMGAIVVVLHR